MVMDKDGVKEDNVRGKHTFTVHGRKPARQKLEQQLIPGIPNEITIDKIAAKLPWTAIHLLASVSCSWQRAIQSHQVYNARVRLNSTQTLVALNTPPSDAVNRITVSSLEDGSFYHLPPIPGVDGGIPRAPGCVFLDGKLYILGGAIENRSPHTFDEGEPADGLTYFSGRPLDEVYVLDLAGGQRQWEQHASMEHTREKFGSCVKDGKIYVFGGICDVQPIYESEVYDPIEDAWSPIRPMPDYGYKNRVTSVGDELFVRDGKMCELDLFVRGMNLASEPCDWRTSAEVYHPIKNTWRTLEDLNPGFDLRLTVGEKFYRLNEKGIESYDMDTGKWNDSEPSMSVKFPQSDATDEQPSYGLYPVRAVISYVLAAVAMDDEVLAMVHMKTGKTRLVKSQGLGGGSKNITWHKLQCSLNSLGLEPFRCPILMCLIQL